MDDRALLVVRDQVSAGGAADADPLDRRTPQAEGQLTGRRPRSRRGETPAWRAGGPGGRNAGGGGGGFGGGGMGVQGSDWRVWTFWSGPTAIRLANTAAPP